MIVLTQRTKRQGYINALARELYASVGNDACMRIVQRLNTKIDLPEAAWQALVARLVRQP